VHPPPLEDGRAGRLRQYEKLLGRQPQFRLATAASKEAGKSILQWGFDPVTGNRF
jgi:hypothetical protein